jgi:hypothetical protein
MHRAPLVLLLGCIVRRKFTGAECIHAAPPGEVESEAAAPTAQADVVAPLTECERAVQILNRFTFGARPGDVDRVLAIGVDKRAKLRLRRDPGLRVR